MTTVAEPAVEALINTSGASSVPNSTPTNRYSSAQGINYNFNKWFFRFWQQKCRNVKYIYLFLVAKSVKQISADQSPSRKDRMEGEKWKHLLVAGKPEMPGGTKTRWQTGWDAKLEKKNKEQIHKRIEGNMRTGEKRIEWVRPAMLRSIEPVIYTVAMVVLIKNHECDRLWAQRRALQRYCTSMNYFSLP